MPNRLTSHGEVVFEPVSSVGRHHPFWGDMGQFWADPLAPAPPPAPGCNACNQSVPVQQSPPFATLAEWYEAAQNRPSDFHMHVKTLKELADGCETVAEISDWDDKPALVALAASAAKVVASVCPLAKRLWGTLAPLRPDLVTAGDDGPVRDGVDLLFWDGQHRAGQVYGALTRYAPHVARYLVVHCTTDPYGETGDDGGPGVMPGVRRFLATRREWTAVRHDKQNHGLIVMSRDDRDKKQLPGFFRKALNFSKAVARDLRNGQRRVNDRVFELRMAECVVCDYRNVDECGACGCPVDTKASWASESCGLVKLGLPPKWDAASDPADLE